MISKRVRNQGTDNFGVLANYIGDDRDQDKVDAFWMVNCKAGESREDLDLAIIEIENTQAMNTRVDGSKTYHLIISLQSGESLPENKLKHIVGRFSDCLGFSEHQHVVAAHSNTDNYHIHVAYNMIHPDTHNIHHPKWDYYARDRVCRSIERDYGLKVDNGHDKWQKWRDDPDYVEQYRRKPDKARDMEAHTHQQSFTTHVREQRQELLSRIEAAQEWSTLHESWAEIGLELKARGAGLVITDGEHHTKASSIDRQISKATLEKKLGEYSPPANAKPEPPKLTEVIQEHRDAILNGIEACDNWQDVHSAFEQYGLEIRKRGNGLTIHQYDEHITASKLDRLLSKQHLEQRFGTFERPESVIDQLLQAPEMLGSVVQSCENWQEVHDTLKEFDVKLLHRGQGYVEANFNQRNTLLDIGAKWDGKIKRWYIPNGVPEKEYQNFATGYVVSDDRYSILSAQLPGLDRQALEQRFGCYETSDEGKKTNKASTFQPYQPKPIQPLTSKKARLIWDRYLVRRRLRPQLTWKEFLLLMGGADPMAVALLNAGRKMLAVMEELMTPAPKAIMPKPYDPLKGEKYLPLYIRVPYSERAEAKALGAKWDPDKQSMFIPHDKRSPEGQKPFAKWEIGLPLLPVQIFSRAKAKAMGAVEDQGIER